MEISGVDTSTGSLDSSQSTQDLLNSDKEVIGAQVVTGSLDKLNSDSFGNTNKEYEMQKKVLTAEAVGKGSMLNTDA